MHAACPKELDETLRDDLGAARFSEQFSENCAEPDDNRDEPERVADAFLKCFGDIGQIHARPESNKQRGEDQPHERIEFETGDEENQRANREQSREQQTGMMAESGHWNARHLSL
jgi:hypothetical protein